MVGQLKKNLSEVCLEMMKVRLVLPVYCIMVTSLKLHSLLFLFAAAPLEDIAEEEEQLEEEEEEGDIIGDEDEMADFIVDEEDVDETGAVVRSDRFSLVDLFSMLSSFHQFVTFFTRISERKR